MKIIGHRGAAGLAVENTIDSIKAALKAGVWGIEIDLRLAADGTFVACHDSTLQRLGNKKLKIESSTMAQIQQVNIANNTKVPSAREAIRHILRADSTTMIILEIKGKKWVKALCKLLDGYAIAERKRFIIASFNLKDLREVQRLHPRIKYLYLYRNVPVGLNLLLARKQEAWGIGIGVNYFSRLMVMASRNLKLTTVAYTVNSPKKARALQKWGVDYIITDFPDRFAILDP